MKTINFLVPALAIMSISFHVSAQQVTSNSYADYKHPQLLNQSDESQQKGSTEIYATDNGNYKDQRIKERKLRKTNKEDAVIPEKRRKNSSYKHPYGI